MPIVRCDRCRFSFEVKDEDETPVCKQCGGSTQPLDPARPRRRETAKTLKMPTVAKPADTPLIPPQNKNAKDET